MKGGPFTVMAEGAPYEWAQLYQVLAAGNGWAEWGRIWNLVSLDDDVNYQVTVRNLGTAGGGRHLRVLRSNDAADIFGVTDSGLTVLALGVTGNVTIGGTLGVAGAITGASTVQGTQLRSTVATGTPPLVVASSTLVSNLNADLLDGMTAADFLTQAEADLRYLQLTGGTLSGSLAVQGALAVDGNTTLGNSIADTVTIAGPALVGGTLGVTGTSTLGVVSAGVSTFTSTIQVQGKASFDGAVDLGNSAGDAIAVIGTASFSQTPLFSASLDVQGGTGGQVRAGALIVNAASLSGTEELRVNGQSRLEGDVTITTGTFRHESGGTARIEANSTGVGFFGSTPIAKPTVTGSRGGNAALQDLCSELANLGLIIDLTS